MDRSLAIKKKAQALVQKGQVDAALAEFEKLFESGDRDPYDFITVADLLAKRGAMQEAVRRYRQAIEEYGKAELYKNAIAVCKKILRISKEDLQIHRSLGELYAKEGLYGDSQIHFLEFAEGSIRRHEFEAALSAVEQVVLLSPDNDDLSEKLVSIAMKADLPERGGKELLRRADRMEQRGLMSQGAELRERASTLAPGLVTERASAAAEPDSAEMPRAQAHAGQVELERSAPAMPYTTSAPTGFGDAPPVEAAPLELESSNGSRYEGARFTPPTPAAPAPAPVAAAPAIKAPAPPDEAPAGPDRHEAMAAEHLKAGQVEPAAEEFWKGAELAFFRSDLARARSLLESLLQIRPNHEPALRRMVDITSQADDSAAEAKARFALGELYLGQQEWGLARAEYMRALELDSSNDRARMRVARIDAMNGEVTGSPVDLDNLPHQKPAASVRVRDDQPAPTDSLVDLEEIIDEFKAGVSSTISGEDHESHYDLGMAYMEMGLYDEAVSEFQIASKGSAIELKCLEMIALCYLEKNEPATAAKELKRALELPGHGPDETISIRYNLGMALERLGNLDKALQYFEEVYLLNVDFFKVATKVRELKQRIAAGGA